LTAIWGTGPTDIFIAAYGGPVYHYRDWPTTIALRLAATGQAASYQTGDDGDLQVGDDWPSPRFTDHGDGTITDNLTGLMWTKDADLAATLGWPFGWMSWQDALDFAALVNAGTLPGGAGHNDWRVPNVNEFYSLFNAGVCSTGEWLMSSGGFEHVQKDYWTSTTYAYTWDAAWMVNIGDEVFCQGGILIQPKDTQNNWLERVWLVRGETTGPNKVWKTGQSQCFRLSVTPGTGCSTPAGPVSDRRGYCPVDCAGTGQDGEIQAGAAWPTLRFIDNGDGTVTDRLSGLMWLQDDSCIGTLSWNDGLNSIAALNAGIGAENCAGYTSHYNDWRMPNRTELESLLDYSQGGPAVSKEYFRFFPNARMTTTWSSTTLKWCTGPLAFALELDSGQLWFNEKTTAYNVWPVRTAPRFTGLRPFPAIGVLRPSATIVAGSAVNLTAAGSAPASPSGVIVDYSWDLDGDGLFGDAAGPEVSHIWSSAGTFTIGLKVTDSSGAVAIKSQTVKVEAALFTDVLLDIMPGSQKNPVNTKSRGLLPVTICGSGHFDISAIDVGSVRLQGVPPIRSAWSKVGPRGPVVLELKFDTREILKSLQPAPVGALDNGAMVELALTGHLKSKYGGGPIRGKDVITLITENGRNHDNCVGRGPFRGYMMKPATITRKPLEYERR
jgi:hypothetical protein